ncbi:MAG: c-type cytochrome [Verrucomicrobia bacterium]|nr:c-type cytochrome [Verrucomicrobiota bacterium]
MKKILFQIGIASLAVFAALLVRGEPFKIELPPETSSFKPAKGVEIANAQCLVCHSVEYVSTQPPLPRAFWATSVKKMREKYGSSIPDSQVEPLLDYLVEHYGAKTSGAPAVSSAASTNSIVAAVEPESKTPEALGTRFGCLACHGPDKKIVGPALKDVAEKYRNDATAHAKITEQVRNGGSGKWGPALMPPFPMLTDEEIKILSDWILALK